jgi:hypothetical protein
MGVDPSSALLLSLLLPRREAGQSNLAPDYQNYVTIRFLRRVARLSINHSSNQSFFNLLFCRRSLVHMLLHASFVIGFHLLDLRLLIGSQQLVELVMNARLGHGELRLDLRLLCG